MPAKRPNDAQARAFCRAVAAETAATLPGSWRMPRAPRVDRALVRVAGRANRWRELLEAGEAGTVYDLARQEQCRVSCVQRHLPLAFLAPALVEQLIDGRQRAWCVLSELVESPGARS